MSRESFDSDRFDRFFDGELGSSEERRLLSDARREDKSFEELAKTRRAIELLHEPVNSPDMTQAILGKVHARRAFLPPKWRRMVSAGRLAAAVALLTGVGAVAMVQRHWPDATSFTPEPRPISAVVECGQSDASFGVRRLVSDLGGIAALAPVFERSLDSGRSLRLSDSGAIPGELSVSLHPVPGGDAEGQRLIAVGWTGVPASNIDGGMSGVYYTGAMPFEVFERSASIRALHMSPAVYPVGGWVVPEKFIVTDDEPRPERD